jgi:hypothetical protein
MTCLLREKPRETTTYLLFPPGERTMRKLTILSALSLMLAGTTGCFHNCCGPGMGGGLFARRAPAPQAVQCCQPVPCCPQPCCDPCAGGGYQTGSPVGVTTMSPVMQAPCCD